MDRQRLELGRNAYDVFVTVPRSAPSLAYRYVARARLVLRPADGSTVTPMRASTTHGGCDPCA